MNIKSIRAKLIVLGWTILAMFLTSYVKGTSVAIVFLGLLYFVDKDILSKLTYQFKNVYTYVFMLPFFLSLLGMLNTSNYKEGWHFVEVNLSLFIFPLITLDFKRLEDSHKWKMLYSGFVLGILIVFVMSIFQSIEQYQENNSISVFFYNHLSVWVMGANHMANYVIFGVIISAIELIRNKQEYLPIKSRFLTAGILLTFVIYTVLLSSKASLLVLVLLMIFFFAYLLKMRIVNRKIIFAILVVLSISFAFALNTEVLKSRISNVKSVFEPREVDYTSRESTVLRMSSLQASLQLIKQNWLFGVGTGDVQDELVKYYGENGYVSAHEEGTYPHNQYLRSFLTFGVLGLFSILLLFYAMYRQAGKHHKMIAYLWIGTMSFLFLTDDFLFFQTGVVYFSMFSALFIFALKKNKEDDTILTATH